MLRNLVGANDAHEYVVSRFWVENLSKTTINTDIKIFWQIDNQSPEDGIGANFEESYTSNIHKKLHSFAYRILLKIPIDR